MIGTVLIALKLANLGKHSWAAAFAVCITEALVGAVVRTVVYG